MGHLPVSSAAAVVPGKQYFISVFSLRCVEEVDLYFPVFALPGLAVVVLGHPEV